MIEEYYVYTQLIIATEAGPVIETDSNECTVGNDTYRKDPRYKQDQVG